MDVCVYNYSGIVMLTLPNTRVATINISPEYTLNNVLCTAVPVSSCI